MTSRQFFGSTKFKDVHTYLYNEQGEPIFKIGYTTYANVNPTIKNEVEFAIQQYKKYWMYKGEPTKCELFTTPSYKKCSIDLTTNKKEFIQL